MRNIEVVDNVVQQIETLITDFYEDNETSYIFTADHGMSVIGNHGDGGKAKQTHSLPRPW
jgi:phosphatidylinositol glycan class N